MSLRPDTRCARGHRAILARGHSSNQDCAVPRCIPPAIECAGIEPVHSMAAFRRCTTTKSLPALWKPVPETFASRTHDRCFASGDEEALVRSIDTRTWRLPSPPGPNHGPAYRRGTTSRERPCTRKGERKWHAAAAKKDSLRRLSKPA